MVCFKSVVRWDSERGATGGADGHDGGELTMSVSIDLLIVVDKASVGSSSVQSRNAKRDDYNDVYRTHHTRDDPCAGMLESSLLARSANVPYSVPWLRCTTASSARTSGNIDGT